MALHHVHVGRTQAIDSLTHLILRAISLHQAAAANPDAPVAAAPLQARLEIPAPLLHRVLASTEVRFRAFGEDTLRGYVASGEGLDKAGSYGIQELGAALVSEVHGSYSNVVGLPAAETIELLEAAGVIEAWP